MTVPDGWTTGPYVFGGIVALLSAAAWALGPVLFSRLGEDVSEAGMNLFKCGLGTLLLGGALAMMGADPLDAKTLVFLVVSGVIGIAVGDTLFYGSLVRLGPKLTVIVSNVGPAITVALAVAFLGESPTGAVVFGMALTLAGATIVAWRRTGTGGGGGKTLSGLLWALGAAFCTAVAVILAKVGVRDISALEGTAVRICAGGVALGAFGAARGAVNDWLKPLWHSRTMILGVGAVLVSMSGFWLFLLALKYTDASVVTVLSSTTPLMVLPITALMSRERVARAEIAGALLGTVGVALIFVGR